MKQIFVFLLNKKQSFVLFFIKKQEQKQNFVNKKTPGVFLLTKKQIKQNKILFFHKNKTPGVFC